jgi:hypothetical protein
MKVHIASVDASLTAGFKICGSKITLNCMAFLPSSISENLFEVSVGTCTGINVHTHIEKNE